MTLIPSIETFWTLYLINVLQPVDLKLLAEETVRLWKSQQREGDVQRIQSSVDELVSSQLVAVDVNSSYSVTLLGLERLSEFKLGKIRDKNRLFLLKKRFKTR